MVSLVGKDTMGGGEPAKVGIVRWKIINKVGQAVLDLGGRVVAHPNYLICLCCVSWMGCICQIGDTTYDCICGILWGGLQLQ